MVYVTFGQIHTHSISGKTIDKDCVMLVEGKTESEVRKILHDDYENKYHNTYVGSPPDMSFFPRGIVSVKL